MDPLPMHGRDLGVNPDDLVESPDAEQEAKQEILENKDVSAGEIQKSASLPPQKKKKNGAQHTSASMSKVVVQHVNVQGLGRTKEDLLGYEISDVFHARNLIDVRSENIRRRRRRNVAGR